MARQPERPRERGVATVHTVLVVAAAIAVGVLVALALVQWFERLS